jgi:hypothetical protein
VRCPGREAGFDSVSVISEQMSTVLFSPAKDESPIPNFRFQMGLAMISQGPNKESEESYFSLKGFRMFGIGYFGAYSTQLTEEFYGH